MSLATRYRFRTRRLTSVVVAVTAALACAIAGVVPAGAVTPGAPSAQLDSFFGQVVVDSARSLFTLTVTNPGPAINHVRIDMALTGSSQMQGRDIQLQYASELWIGADLEGTADAPGGITGYFGIPQGSTLQSGQTVYHMRIAFLAGAPADTVTATFNVDSVDLLTDEPSTTLAAATGQMGVVLKTNPVAPNLSLTATSGVAKEIDLAPTNADGLYCRETFTPADHGTVTSLGAYDGSVLSYLAPAGYVGPASFTYTATAPGSELQIEDPLTATGTVTIQVKAPTSLTTALSPTRPMVDSQPRLKISAHSVGGVDGASIIVSVGGSRLSAVLTHGTTTVTLPRMTAGPHSIIVAFPGTSTAQPVTAGITESVLTHATHLSATTTPTRVTTSTAHPQIVVRVTSAGGSVEAGRVTLYSGTTAIGHATVSHGRAVITVSELKAVHYAWRLKFAGTATTSASTLAVALTVLRA